MTGFDDGGFAVTSTAEELVHVVDNGCAVASALTAGLIMGLKVLRTFPLSGEKGKIQLCIEIESVERNELLSSPND